MQATFLKRILPFFLTLILGIGVSFALGRVLFSKKNHFSYRMARVHGERECKYSRKFSPAVTIKSVPDAQLPPFFDSYSSEGMATIKMEALFDSSGHVTAVRFPQFKPYSLGGATESQMRSFRLEQELMSYAGQQVKQIEFRPLHSSQWLNVETFISKKAPGRGCSSVMVKISDQNGMRWEGETLAEGRRCGANQSSL